jgi:PPOX class probable F420-dependent enzyme
VTEIGDEARAVLESDALAHLVTSNADGSAQVSCVWVGLEGSDIVFASLGPRRKLDNIRRDPRVTLSLEGTETSGIGLKEYLVVHGRARIDEGGGPELLQHGPWA